MYIALAIMFAGILAGRLLRRHLLGPLLGRLTMVSILLLLFLLGVAIGGNNHLLESLPRLGWQAIILMLFCVIGSIIFSVLATPFVKPAATESIHRENA